MELRFPDHEMLPSYIAALHRGWSPSSSNPSLRVRELEKVEADPDRFLAELVDVEGKGPPVELPDGSTVDRIPGYRKWMWDGEYCGGISFRWLPPQPDRPLEALPPHVLGHIGYGVVAWKRRQGYATQALKMLLPEVAARGFRYVEVTTDLDNVASRKVIESAGGELYERFTMPPSRGAGPGLRYRIVLRSSMGGDVAVPPPDQNGTQA